jgi:hypothetical protein
VPAGVKGKLTITSEYKAKPFDVKPDKQTLNAE